MARVWPAAGQGKAYLADNYQELTSALSSIIGEVLDTSSAFVAPVVPTSPENKVYSGQRIYLGFFKPQLSGKLGWQSEKISALMTTSISLIKMVMKQPIRMATSNPNPCPTGERVPTRAMLKKAGSAIFYSIATWSRIQGISIPIRGTSSSLTNTTNALTTSNTAITEAMLDVASATAKNNVNQLCSWF